MNTDHKIEFASSLNSIRLVTPVCIIYIIPWLPPQYILPFISFKQWTDYKLVSNWALSLGLRTFIDYMYLFPPEISNLRESLHIF